MRVSNVELLLKDKDQRGNLHDRNNLRFQKLGTTKQENGSRRRISLAGNYKLKDLCSGGVEEDSTMVKQRDSCT